MALHSFCDTILIALVGPGMKIRSASGNATAGFDVGGNFCVVEQSTGARVWCAPINHTGLPHLKFTANIACLSNYGNLCIIEPKTSTEPERILWCAEKKGQPPGLVYWARKSQMITSPPLAKWPKNHPVIFFAPAPQLDVKPLAGCKTRLESKKLISPLLGFISTGPIRGRLLVLRVRR